LNILLTGFEPFGGSFVNPSEQVVKSLDGSVIANWIVTGIILPVDNRVMPSRLFSALNSVRPDAVLCLGEAARRSAISLERIAVNLQDYELPDNRGERIVDQPIRVDGPTGYFSTLPLQSIYESIQQADIPVEYSLSAGAYLCNQAFYLVMDYSAGLKQPVPAGFIHLPSLPQQAARRTPPSPSMELGMTLKGIRLAVQAIATART